MRLDPAVVAAATSLRARPPLLVLLV